RNAALHDELEQYKRTSSSADRALSEFATAALPDLVPGLLTDEPVLVLAARGIDTNSVTLLQQLLADAGATSLGTVWFDRRMDLTDAARLEAVADALGLTPVGDEDRESVTAALAEALTSETPEPVVIEPEGLPGPAVGDAVTGDPNAEGPTAVEDDALLPFDAIAALADAELIDWVDAVGERARLESFPAGRVRLIVLSGEGAELNDDIVVQPLVRAIAADRSGLLVGEVHKPRSTSDAIRDAVQERRGMTVDFVREDDTLRNRVVTVDNVESGWGRLAAVLAFSGVDQRLSGAYGVADSADQVLPDAEG
ncbi:MAG: copper transporter, partial [Actinobacteria bacterium]|nr:copper transporter [Actinomycetota bacterium]